MAKVIKLWGAGTARTLRPIWMAEELEINYELFPIGPRTGETQTPEFTKINPKQKIPALQHGEFNLSESLAICRYLQKNFSILQHALLSLLLNSSFPFFFFLHYFYMHQL